MNAPLKTTEYGPLDEAAYRHQALLLRSLHWARPVMLAGREVYIHTVSASLSGGHIEMTVYMTGDPTPTPSKLIEVKP